MLCITHRKQLRSGTEMSNQSSIRSCKSEGGAGDGCEETDCFVSQESTGGGTNRKSQQYRNKTFNKTQLNNNKTCDSSQDGGNGACCSMDNNTNSRGSRPPGATGDNTQPYQQQNKYKNMAASSSSRQPQPQQQQQNRDFEELENSDYLDEDDYLTYCFARNKASSKSPGDCVIISQSQDLHVDLNYFVQK